MWRRRKSRPAIIVGSGHREYMLYLRLEEEGKYKVLFFIDEEPWSHRTRLGSAELRYPVELPALCKKHGVELIFYCDDRLIETLPRVEVSLLKDEEV